MIENLKSRADLHIARKVFHSATVLGILLCMVFLPPSLNWTIYFTIGLPLVLLDRFRTSFPKVNHFLLKTLGPVVRKHEAHKMTGASFAIIGIGLAYFLFPKPIACLAVLFLAIGDPMASLFGVCFGKIKLIGQKSLVGTLAGFFFCSLSAFIFLTLQSHTDIEGLILKSLLFGAVGAVSELVDLKVDDNLSQPLVSSTLLTAIISLTGVTLYG